MAVDLDELVAAVEAAVLADGAVGLHRTYKVVRALLLAIHRRLYGEPQDAVLKRD